MPAKQLKHWGASAPETKRVAIYCRVSTIDQGKGDYSSLDSQAELEAISKIVLVL